MLCLYFISITFPSFTVPRSLHSQWRSSLTSKCSRLNTAGTPRQSLVNRSLPHLVSRKQPRDLRMHFQGVGRLQYSGSHRSVAGHFPPMDTFEQSSIHPQYRNNTAVFLYDIPLQLPNSRCPCQLSFVHRHRGCRHNTKCCTHPTVGCQLHRND